MNDLEGGNFWVVPQGPSWSVVREDQLPFMLGFSRRADAIEAGRIFAEITGVNVVILPENDDVCRQAFCVNRSIAHA